MEKTGVELVVEGLSAFIGEMGKADKAVGNFGKSGSLLGTIFSKVGDVISGLIGGVFRILEYTLGNLLASAIQSVVGWLRDLAAGVLESADTFAKLEIRLKRMNFNAARDSGLEYNAAMEEAVRLTKEQLEWTIRLGAQTPFDAVDIAKVYTLARSYGFTAGESKSLTDAIIDFTSGMGLTNVEMERIVINFGQLRQQGKLNAQDLRDLARGAYVPINDVLAITAKKLGLTTEEFNKQRKAGTLGAEAVDVFRQSFEELVGVNFEGAAKDLGNVFKVAVENITHLIRDMLALYNVLPVLTLIGTYLQDVSDAISENDERWNTVTASLKRISDTIFEIVSTLLGLAPSADTIADSIVKGLNKFAVWLEEHQDDIVKFFIGVADSIKNMAVWITDTAIPAFLKLSAWFIDNKPLIFEFFKSLGEIISNVFSGLTGSVNVNGGGVLESIKSFMQFVVDNKEKIAQWVEILLRAVVIYYAIKIAWEVLQKVAVVLASSVLFLIGIWKLLSGALFLVRESIQLVIAILGSPITWVIAAVVANIWLAIAAFTTWKNMALAALDAMRVGFQLWWANVVTSIQNVKNAFLSGDWVGVGRAVVQGVINGIGIMVGTLVAAAVNAARAAYNAARRALGIRSPSTLFMEIGEFSMKGMAIGIEKYAGLASDAMLRATSQMAMSSMGMMPSNTTNIQNSPSYNNTLNIHTSAQTENIVSDFAMMQSLAGG